jgi:type I restriction enzyme, S subunit
MKLFPEHWKTDPVNQLCTDVVDCVNKTAPVVDGPTKFKMIRTTNVKGGRINLEECRYVDEATFIKWTRRIKPQRDDIVLTREAPLGEVGLLRSDESVFLGQRTMLYRANPKKLDQRFLYYSMLGPFVQGQIKSQGSGATVEHLRVPDAESFLVAYPPLDEQRRIAAILSALDDLITNAQRRISLLESMTDEIYREWFVRMRCPVETSENADGKRLMSFDHLCELQRGFDLPDVNMQAGDVPVIASTSIKGFHNVAKVKPPVITTGRSGSLGTVLYVRRPAWPLNTSLWVKDFKGNSPNFVYFTLRELKLEQFNAGAGVPTLNRNHLRSIKVRIPTPASQVKFDEVVDPILTTAEKLREASQKLIEMRDALLPRLISGKLRIDHLDIQFPPSMKVEQAQAA